MISAVDSDDIYKIPLLLREQALDDIVVDKLGLSVPPDRPGRMAPGGRRQVQPGRPGRYRDGRQVRAGARLLHFLNEALTHGGLKTRTRVNVHYIESTDIEQHGTHALAGMDAILVPGGFGERGIEGKIAGRALCA